MVVNWLMETNASLSFVIEPLITLDAAIDRTASSPSH
jgi:aromatic ring-cleaving dioxygenase